MVISTNKIIRAVTVSMSVNFYVPLVKDLQAKGHEIVSVSSDGPELENLRKLGVKTIIVEMERHISIVKDLKSLIQLIKVFKDEKPYMVHSMTPKAGLLCMLAAWITRVPRRVHTFTGLVWPTERGLKRRILMATDWLTCACATHVIPEGQGVMNDLQQHITRKPMKVLGYGNVMGVDMKRFNPERFIDVKKDENKFRYTFVGRIVGDKGINELVEAFVRLNKEYPATQLTLVGKYEANLDPVKPETLKAIEENPCIDACGPKYGDELLVEYVKSDCFVFPSYREGFPNTVLEAGAMGLPSIVTDINGSREIIVDGENGIIIPSKSVNELYSAMERMLLDKELHKRLAEKAMPMIESRFEQGFVRKCLYDFYDEIM